MFAIACHNQNWENKRSPGGYNVPKFLSAYICPEADSDDDMRRLVYVASTRAKQVLNISAYRKTDGDWKLSTSQLFNPFINNENFIVEEVPPFELPIVASNYYELSGPADLMASIKNYIEIFEISPTSLGSIEDCQNKFLFTQILKLQTPGAEALSFGSMTHDVLDEYASSPNSFKTNDALIALIEKYYAKHQHIFCKNRGPKYLKYAKWLIPAYLSKYPITQKPFSLEETYHGVIGNGVKIKGKLDRIEKSASGIKVVDYKSGKTAPKSKPFIDDNNTGSQYWKQATIYTALMQQNFKDADQYNFEFHYIEQDKIVTPFVYERNEGFEKWLEILHTNIKQMRFQEQCLNPECIYCKNKIA